MQELCDSQELAALPEVCAVLARTLASPLIEDAYVDSLLDMVEDLYPAECAALAPTVAALRVCGQEPPPEQCASAPSPAPTWTPTRPHSYPRHHLHSAGVTGSK